MMMISRIVTLICLVLVVKLPAQSPRDLPSDVESLRALIRLTPDRIAKLSAIAKLLKILPKDEPTLTVVEQMGKEAAGYSGPSPELYANGTVVPNKLNPDFERLALSLGQSNPTEYGRVLTRDYMISIRAAEAFLPRSRSLPILLEGVRSPLAVVASSSITYAANTDNLDEVFKVFDAYLQRPKEQPNIISSMAIALVRRKAVRENVKVVDFFRSQGFSDNYATFLKSIKAN